MSGTPAADERDSARPDRLSGTAFAGELRRAIGRLYREHPTLGITLTYLFLTTIGAAYEFSLLIRFRVNVFQYADPIDFLLAAVRQPLVAAFAALPLVVLWLFDLTERWMRRSIPGYVRFSNWSDRRAGLVGDGAKATQRIGYVMIILLYFVGATLTFAKYVSARLRAGEGRPVRVALAGPGVNESARVRGTLLGTTSRFAFVYEPADSITHVVPLESITDMVLDPRKPRR